MKIDIFPSLLLNKISIASLIISTLSFFIGVISKDPTAYCRMYYPGVAGPSINCDNNIVEIILNLFHPLLSIEFGMFFPWLVPIILIIDYFIFRGIWITAKKCFGHAKSRKAKN